MASINSYVTKKGEKRYEFQLHAGIDRQTGKSKRIHRKGFKTQKEATLLASRLELKVNEGDLKTENNILFSDVYEEWFQSYIYTVKESTYARVPKMFSNHILPAFGNKRIRTIQPADIQRTVNGWYREVKVNYKKWYHFTNMVFKYALIHGYIDKNPVELVTLPKKKGQWQDAHNKYWNKEELKQFFEYIDPVREMEKFTLFRLLAFTGMRKGECLALTWEDVDFKKSKLDINKTVAQGENGKQIIQTPKTTKGQRVITIDKVTLKQLKRWQLTQKKRYLDIGINTENPKQLIFANRKNGLKSLNTPGKWLHRIIDGKPNEFSRITVHKLRHTHATLMIESGATVKEVQARLGDADIGVILNVYAHVTEGKERETTEKLANYISDL